MIGAVRLHGRILLKSHHAKGAVMECKTQLTRIEEDRIGYTGYTCLGRAEYVIASMDCSGNKWKQLPPRALGAVSDAVFENISALYELIRTQGSRLNEYYDVCDLNFDPFTGDFVDLYTGFIEAGLSALIPELCYALDGEHVPGYTPAVPLMDNVKAAGGGADWPSSSSSGSSSSA